MTRAAHKLHVTQPALSHAIAQLERRLGVKLLERHAHGVSLTEAGEAFLAKTRPALAAVAEAELAAQPLATTTGGVIEFGFLGVPPGLDSPGPLADFSQTHPATELRFRELPFPFAPTASWLAEVDVAICHAPPVDPGVWSQELRREPRVVLAPSRHPLAQRSELCVADVLEETFVGMHPSVEPTWAGFWSLDDHRGAPAKRVTLDRARNPQELLASLAVHCAITTAPGYASQVLSSVLTGVVAIPLRDADPSTITLVGHAETNNPHAAAMRAFASGLVDSGSGP